MWRNATCAEGGRRGRRKEDREVQSGRRRGGDGEEMKGWVHLGTNPSGC